MTVSSSLATGVRYHRKVHQAVAVNIIVFGRGLTADEHGFHLTQASCQRVETLVSYVARNQETFDSRRGKVVFSGGWAAAADGIQPPPVPFREGSMMLHQALASNVNGNNLMQYVDTYAETESDSTLENILRTKEEGYFGGVTFNAFNPLGLVAHQEHLIRIAYLVRRIFNLQDDAIMQIATPGIDKLSGGLSEETILLISRIALIGARTNRSLRRRHQILVAGRRKLHAGAGIQGQLC